LSKTTQTFGVDALPMETRVVGETFINIFAIWSSVQRNVSSRTPMHTKYIDVDAVYND